MSANCFFLKGYMGGAYFDELMINFNVLNLLMLNWIVGYIDGQLFITIELHKTFLAYSKVTKKIFYPKKLT